MRLIYGIVGSFFLFAREREVDVLQIGKCSVEKFIKGS